MRWRKTIHPLVGYPVDGGKTRYFFSLYEGGDSKLDGISSFLIAIN
ncbi:MAG: hypothetical protein AB4040_02540 [Synechococcus sp.]